MLYKEYGNTGIKLSVIGLGGHEFHTNGKIKGFSDNGKLAVQPGHIFEGFGAENREEIVKKALDLGINFLDVTIDSEKEAIGRILKKLKPSQELFLQTRPEGMVYSYDPANRKMADYTLLKEEVVRILKLLQRDTLELLNFAFMKEALENDPEYMEKIGDNVKRLKGEGLIRFANADTFSGNEIYMKQIESGHFDSIFINYNIAQQHMEDHVIPGACKKSMGVLTRELFMKGKLFTIAEEAGIADRNAVARFGLKWVLGNPHVTSAVLGIASVDQLKSNVRTLDALKLEERELAMLDTMVHTAFYKELAENNKKDFYKNR